MSARAAPAPQGAARAATDAELVAAIRAGRTEAWGDVYDRHLDRVYGVCFAVLRNRADAEDAAQASFLKAVERIGQLRDPALLAGWLSGIARRAAIDRIRATRETPVDDWPVGDPADEDDPTTGLRRGEAAALVSDALDGLDARDRLALVLADVDGLDGDSLAESLGVRRDHAYVLVRRARERFGRSVAALVVGRAGRRDCPDLARLVGPEGGSLDPRLRKRVARHIDDCERCRETRARRVSPAALLSLLPPIVSPAALRTREIAARLTEAAAAHPAGVRRPGRRGGGRRPPWLAGGVAAATAVAVTTGVWLLTREEPGRETTGATSAPRAATSAPGAGTTAPRPAETGYCGTAGEWLAGSTPGPASPDPVDVEEWFTRNLDHVERLAAAAPAEVAQQWDQYRAAYAALVGELRRADWDIGAAATSGDAPELEALRDEIEADVASRCGLVPPS